ncbi:MAG: GatB/YqeY domain-containing protein [Proteobacteria bacterium]|nr:GatB/YqeY domain-containing protein [Pseudomonadota bacterium]MBU1714952.1 GatB/YqeY domain-containing protein [Pseudomonadota bacterium]
MTDQSSSTYGWHSGLGISLHQKIRDDLKHSMTNRDDAEKSAIRQVISEFPKLTVPLTLESGKKSSRPKSGDEITDDDILDIIRGLVKSEKTVLELTKKESSDYLQILEKYLPQMASREEISQWIAGNIDLGQFKSPMQAMGSVMKHFGKLADGNVVKSILQNLAES